MRILLVAGARPNFMKIAPMMSAFRESSDLEPVLVHTGQHYDKRMSELFFEELEIPQPDINLGVGSGSHAHQTGSIMQLFEPVVLQQKPDAVLVVGDVNSTIACGMVASKLGVPLIHVEAGLRSFDRTMPEEVNRVLTDSISDLLFCTEQSGVDNLEREGIALERVHLVGNVMVDTLLRNREKAAKSTILQELELDARGYAVLTLHRPANVDDVEVFGGILDALEEVQSDMPVLFPTHPRTKQRLESSALGDRVRAMPALRLVPPAGYLDFVRLMDNARIVLTDSGGIQEETTILGVPCLTLRENTERPITISTGTNRLVGRDSQKILSAYRDAMNGAIAGNVPPLWDGKAAARIASIVADWGHSVGA